MSAENSESLKQRVHPSSDELAFQRTQLSNTRSYMANERTHLAYLRTALSLMSFGITLNRFSIYLREGKMSPAKVPQLLHETATVGIGIVILGVIILCWALYRYRQVNIAIKTDSYKSSNVAISILTTGLLILGGGTALWMISDWK
jgi:putative membrane protein